MTVMARCVLVSIVVLAMGCLNGRFRRDRDEDRVLPTVDLSQVLVPVDGGAGVVSKDPPSLDPAVAEQPPSLDRPGLRLVAPSDDDDEHDCPE